MDKLFLTVLNMSVTGGVVIGAICLVRLLLKKVPKVISYCLWAVAGFRLVVPFSIEGVWSLIPFQSQPIPVDLAMQAVPRVESGMAFVDTMVNDSLTMVNASPPVASLGNSVNPLEAWITVGAYVWLVGALGMAVYGVYSYASLKRKMQSARFMGSNVYEAENIKSPFVLGILWPKIYLPTGLSEKEREYILFHEQTHMRRRDPMIKCFAYFILCLHWFNPLAWVAFHLMGVDMELSCDERVLKHMGDETKKDYALSLLSLATEGRMYGIRPLAFGEGGVKGRIKNILGFRKSSPVAVLFAVTVAIVFTLGFGVNPMSPKEVVAQVPRAEALQETITHNAPERIKENAQESIPQKDGAVPDQPTKVTAAKINFLSPYETVPSENEVITTQTKAVAYIETTLASAKIESEKNDFENNHTDQYTIALSSPKGAYGYKLYYDTLYHGAYLEKNGKVYEINLEFARFIASLFETQTINFEIIDTQAVALFQQYGWTLSYEIATTKEKLHDIKTASEFDPNAYYFAYHNELSKDIGLDMSGFFGGAEVDISIYRLLEPMPSAFDPIQDGRGIVVKQKGKIIGAFISAGRHSTFHACSLKGNSFETVTKQEVSLWLADQVRVGQEEQQQAKLAPTQIIEAYFSALEHKDEKAAIGVLSKAQLLRQLAVNMPDELLFGQQVGLPLVSVGFDGTTPFENLKSVKLLKVEFLNEPEDGVQRFRVTMDLQYEQDISIESGEQFWDCTMVYESPQTGWKVKEFGHL